MLLVYVNACLIVTVASQLPVLRASRALTCSPCACCVILQALMPDALHWIGVTRIHRLVSMSDMKYDAITASVCCRLVELVVDFMLHWFPMGHAPSEFAAAQRSQVAWPTPKHPCPRITYVTSLYPRITCWHLFVCFVQGIEVLERVPIPKELIPSDAHVEIDAKVSKGYHGGATHTVTDADLKVAKGRTYGEKGDPLKPGFVGSDPLKPGVDHKP